jgi:hypothetical protein
MLVSQVNKFLEEWRGEPVDASALKDVLSRIACNQVHSRMPRRSPVVASALQAPALVASCMHIEAATLKCGVLLGI